MNSAESVFSGRGLSVSLRQRGMTLLELAVVMLVLVALAGLTIPYIGNTGQAAACQITDATLAAVRDAIMGTGVAPGYLSDVGSLPLGINDLFTQPVSINAFNPVTRRGWHGPYIQNGVLVKADRVVVGPPNGDLVDHNFTSLASSNVAVAAGDTVAVDGYKYANPVVFQFPCSDANGDGRCGNAADIPLPDRIRLVSAGPDGVLNTLLTDATAAGRNDDRVLFLKIADPGGNQPCND